MIEKKHNKNSLQFMQKILIFIDSALLNSTNSNPENTSKILFSGILNLRDAIFAEIIKDNQVELLNKLTQEKKELKKKENLATEGLSDLNQEIKSDKDQSVLGR